MAKDLEQVYKGNNMMQSPYLVDRDISSSNVNVGGARRSHYLRGCVSVCLDLALLVIP